MPHNNLREYLLSEMSVPFSGWDFSYLNGRMEESALPWSYRDTVVKNLTDKKRLLDIDTGGGEFLDSLVNLPKSVFATEGYEPNIPIAENRLSKKNIIIKTTHGCDNLPFPDSYFDIIINRHGSFRLNEIKRLLSPNGIFITQQVGSLNAVDLNLSLAHKPLNIGIWNLSILIEAALKENFKIIEYDEYYGKYRFFDAGAIVYYLKCIPWQVTDFDIDRYLDRLIILHELIERKGFIDFICHRFYAVAKKEAAI